MRFFILLYFVFLSPLISQNLKLCEVNKAKNPLITVDQEYLLKTLYGPFVVDHGKSDKQLVPTNIHPFIYAAHKAFAEHRPLVISPDGIWTLITQGTQIYLSQNSKEYREYSKSLLNDPALTVNGDISDTSWLNILDQFHNHLSDKLEHPGEQLYDISFSTTGMNIRNARKVMKVTSESEEFEISLFTLCGIPEITLEGKTEDWVKIRQQLKVLKEIGMNEWADHLTPVIDEFVNASKGEVNKHFWNSFYKFNDECGDAKITGWILNFFPYNKKGGVREFVKYKAGEDFKLVPHSDPNISFPSGRNFLPFKLKKDGEINEMRFEAGFMGVSQNPETLALKAEINWAVVKRKATGRLAVWQQNVVREGSISAKKLSAAYSATYIDIDSFLDEQENGLQNLEMLEYAIVKKAVQGAFLDELTKLPHFKSLECHDWNLADKYLPLISKLKNEQFVFSKPVKEHFFRHLPPSTQTLVFSGLEVKKAYFENIEVNSIKRVIFENCTFEEGTIAALGRLQNSLMEIEFNKCKSLNQKELSQINNAANLLKLSLTSCKLSELPDLNLERLESLNLSSNNLKSLEPINSLKALKQLNAAGNRIHGRIILDQFKGLEELILHHNYIQHATLKLPKLRKLDMSSNRLELIPEMAACPLVSLQIEKNLIPKAAFPDFLTETLEYLILEEVKLSRNDISQISKMKQLQVLSLKNCALENGDMSRIIKLENLKSLCIWTNRSLDDVCKGDIIKLFLRGTDISIFDCGFSSGTMDEFAKLREKMKVN